MSLSQTRYPTSDLLTTNWTNSGSGFWDSVNDPAGSPDDGLTFIYPSVNMTEVRYIAGFSAFTLPENATNISLRVNYRGMQTEGTIGLLGGSLKINNAYIDLGNGLGLTYSWANDYDDRAIAVVGVPWTAEMVNGGGDYPLQGFGVWADDDPELGYIRVTQIYLVAYYDAPPLVTTSAVTGVLINTATGNGEVTDAGSAAVTERGVCWKTSTGPTTADSKATSGSGTGAFTASMTGLSPGILYYVRAYAINSVGTAYGSEVTFTTGIPIGSGGSGACSSGFPLTTDGW